MQGTLQRSVPVHGKLGALHHGRGILNHKGKPTLHRLQRGKSSLGNGSSRSARAARNRPHLHGRPAQQELGRIRAARRAGTAFRLHGLRQRRQGSLPALAGTAHDRALGRSRSGRRRGRRRQKSSAPSAKRSSFSTGASACSLSLPLASLDRLALKKELDDIGQAAS